MRSRLVIHGGTVLDQTGRRDADVAIEDGVVVAVGSAGEVGDADDVLEAHGCIVAPGFVDLHVHLREPGREEAETIETGSRAAALGGFTAVVAMPNTDPAQDSVAVVDFVRTQGERAGLCEVLPSGCITIGREGRVLAPFGELAAAGVRLFTDDGNGVQDPLLMRRALEYASALDITLAQHCEVAALTKGAVMHQGACCSRLGLPGWPAVAEELMVQRDIELCRLVGAPIHLLHLSTARSVSLVREAKADGLPVTAEAAPHHFTLTDSLLEGYDPVFKVNPPLRTRPTSPRSRPAWPTARSTRSPPTTRRTRRSRRRRRSTRRRRGCSAWRPRWPCRSASWTCRSSGSSPRSAGSRRANRPRRRPSRPPDRPRRAGQHLRVRPDAGVGGRAHPSGEQEPQHPVRRPHLARQGAPHDPRRPPRRPPRRRHEVARMPAPRFEMCRPTAHISNRHIEPAGRFEIVRPAAHISNRVRGASGLAGDYRRVRISGPWP